MKMYNLIPLLVLVPGTVSFANPIQDYTKQQELDYFVIKNEKVINDYYKTIKPYLPKNVQIVEFLKDKHNGSAKCNKPPLSIPPKKEWKKITKPLKILKVLEDKKLIESYEIISVYRDPTENACLNGAKKSKHLHNLAIDFRVNNLDKDSYTSAENSLCKFWRKNGIKYNLGLGAYGDGFFHVDADGYRTWGHDYSAKSSMCNKKMEIKK